MVIFPQLVQNFLEASADHWPNKVALICENRRLTYAEIETSANRISKALIDGGVRRGDRFAIYLPNSIASVLGIFGALKASATFVVINATTKLDKLINILNNCQATAILFDTQKMELAPAILQACPSLRLIIFSSWSDRMRFLSKNDSVDILDLDTIERSYPVQENRKG
jgi:acyl-CoA synthetase (AMP-forming)/AMP-acid ligase II